LLQADESRHIGKPIPTTISSTAPARCLAATRVVAGNLASSLLATALDDNETRISGARRADVTGVGAWEPSCRGFGIAKILKKRQLHRRQCCHPVDVG